MHLHMHTQSIHICVHNKHTQTQTYIPTYRYTHGHTYIHIQVHTYTHAHTCTHKVCTHVRICTIYTNTSTHIHAHMYIHAHTKYTQTHVYTSIHKVYTYTNTNLQVSTCTHTYTYTDTDTQMYTCAHTSHSHSLTHTYPRSHHPGLLASQPLSLPHLLTVFSDEDLTQGLPIFFCKGQDTKCFPGPTASWPLCSSAVVVQIQPQTVCK